MLDNETFVLWELWIKQSHRFFQLFEINFPGYLNNISNANKDNWNIKFRQWLEDIKKEIHQIGTFPKTNFCKNSNEIYQKAYDTYTSLLSEIEIKAFDLLYEKLMEQTSEGKSPIDIRQVYEAWLDCSERSYENMTTTKKYQRAYAKFINATILKCEEYMLQKQIGNEPI